MKKIRIISSVALIFLMSLSTHAQIKALDFLYAGVPSDANLILQEYLRPYANIMGANLNASWYNTAEPHKLGGFDITTSISLTTASVIDLSYDLSSLGLSADISSSSTTIAPTIAGKATARPEFVYSTQISNPSGEVETIEFPPLSHPDGIGVKSLPLPMAQLSIGLIKGTDVSVRFVPMLQIGEVGEVGLFGVGGRHSISQWIPVLNRLKFINISLQGGYTKVSTSAKLNMQPISTIQPTTTSNWDDQFITMNLSGWTINLIASQSIPVITVYEGIGFASSAVDLGILGTFPFNSVVTEEGPDFGKTTYVEVTDPIPSLAFNNFNNLRLNAGIRFKLGVLTLHYDFTRTSYSTHTAGLGITFR